jgi:NADH dehydrogenase
MERTPARTSTAPGRHRVVVVGGGFGGLLAVRGLRRAPVEITLVDRRNFHLFQPLLYQAATGAVSPDDIATPLRTIVRRQKNVRVIMGEVAGFDLDARRVKVDGLASGGDGDSLEYDTLIVASGARYTFFGHDEWQPYTLEVKSLENALETRGRIFTAFEAAETEHDPERRAAWLTFVVVGGGPTGVEMAGQIAELARDALPREFHAADVGQARIIIVEAADRVLAAFPPRLSTKAGRALERLGVTLMLGTTVVDIDASSVSCRTATGDTLVIPTHTVIWAAGVVASELSGVLAAAAGAEVDRAGRIAVGPELTVAGRAEVLALGDMASVRDSAGAVVPLPGLASVAMQQGRYAAGAIRARIDGKSSKAFHYRDKGNLATIGRARAVADIKGIQLSGLLAWVTWLGVHIVYLIGFQNRVIVLTRWAVSFFTHRRGARLITGGDVHGAPAPPDGSAGRPGGSES